MVEWKKLEEIVKRNKGIPITAGQMSELNSPNGNVRVFAAGQTIADIDEDQLPKGCAYTKPSVVVKSRGYIDFEFYDKPFTHKSEMWSYSFEDINLCKYVYYYLTTKTEEFRKKAKTNSVKLPQLCVSDTDKYQIPIPSLSEQNRIVGILDTFTDSIDNLKQQIAQRRKQYEFYRDCILKHFDSKETTWKKLSEIAEIFKGPYITKKNSNEGAVPVVMGGQKAAYYIDNYNSEGESIVISRSGINAGYVSFWNQPIFVSDGYRIDNKDLMVKKYLFYFLKSIEDKINLSKKGAGVPHVQSKFLLNILIPVPPLSEQSRIVSILDTFEASISNLEAQLAQRQKQYEYYRNQLLTFE